MKNAMLAILLLSCGSSVWSQSIGLNFESTLNEGGARALADQQGQDAERRRQLARLSDDNPYVRQVAIMALKQRIGEAEIRDAVLVRLTDKDYFVRAQAVDALAPLAKDEPVRSALIKRAKDPEGIVRARVAPAL